MKKNFNFFTLILFVFLISSNVAIAQSDGPITGFLIKMAEVKQLTDQGAKSIKIFAAKDDTGAPHYVLVGLDAGGQVMRNKVFVIDGTGDCPPTCDFMPPSLNAGIVLDEAAAAGYVDNYMNSFPESENAIIICAESIEKVAEKYNFMKVTMTGKVKISGVKDDGVIPFLASFSKDCNQAVRSSL